MSSLIYKSIPKAFLAQILRFSHSPTRGNCFPQKKRKKRISYQLKVARCAFAVYQKNKDGTKSNCSFLCWKIFFPPTEKLPDKTKREGKKKHFMAHIMMNWFSSTPQQGLYIHLKNSHFFIFPSIPCKLSHLKYLLLSSLPKSGALFPSNVETLSKTTIYSTFTTMSRERWKWDPPPAAW